MCGLSTTPGWHTIFSFDCARSGQIIGNSQNKERKNKEQIKKNGVVADNRTLSVLPSSQGVTMGDSWKSPSGLSESKLVAV